MILRGTKGWLRLKRTDQTCATSCFTIPPVRTPTMTHKGLGACFSGRTGILQIAFNPIFCALHLCFYGKNSKSAPFPTYEVILTEKIILRKVESDEWDFLPLNGALHKIGRSRGTHFWRPKILLLWLKSKFRTVSGIWCGFQKKPSVLKAREKGQKWLKLSINGENSQTWWKSTTLPIFTNIGRTFENRFFLQKSSPPPTHLTPHPPLPM